jgi:hypothetical protein
MIKKESNSNSFRKETKMSIEMILNDNELELMQKKETESGKVVYAIDTNSHKSYFNVWLL